MEPTSNNLGGFEYRKYLIDSIRKVNANVLLLDAGDIVQGTPYFNVYGGQVEVEAYNEMGYDAITLGNHEFDNGVDGLAKMLKMRNSRWFVLIMMPLTLFWRIG